MNWAELGNETQQKNLWVALENTLGLLCQVPASLNWMQVSVLTGTGARALVNPHTAQAGGARGAALPGALQFGGKAFEGVREKPSPP